MKSIYVRAWLLTAGCLLLSLAARSQVTTISGTVLSGDNNQPLPGVNILVKGTTAGSQTDANGLFALEASKESVLIFSFI